jgi:hypothetical protein
MSVECREFLVFEPGKWRFMDNLCISRSWVSKIINIHIEHIIMNFVHL